MFKGRIKVREERSWLLNKLSTSKNDGLVWDSNYITKESIIKIEKSGYWTHYEEQIQIKMRVKFFSENISLKLNVMETQFDLQI